MKKVRIPFSIGDYQEGCYTVETRGDENHKPYSVRIFTVDLLSRYQTILGAEKIENREVVGCWFYNGNFFSEDEENYQDLLLVKEEFEDGDILADDKDIKPKCALRPFDKVLVRNSNYHCWVCQLFGYKTNYTKYPFMCMSSDYDQCIPYNEETKHLIGTTDDAPEKYKTW